MTLDEEAKQILAEVAALNPGRGRKYTTALRERVLTAVCGRSSRRCPWAKRRWRRTK
jgi:hypothetical protein